MRTQFENLQSLLTPHDSFGWVDINALREATTALLSSHERGANPEEKAILARALQQISPRFDAILTASEAIEAGSSYLSLLMNAHKQGMLTATELYRIAYVSKIGLYMACPYYCIDDYETLFEAGVVLEEFTAVEKSTKLEALYNFLSYLEAQGVSLAGIHSITSQVEYIVYYAVTRSPKGTGLHIFIDFLSKAPGSVILKYIAANFLPDTALSDATLIETSCVKKVVAAIKTEEANSSFALILAANDKTSSLGRYFSSWYTAEYLRELNQMLSTTFVEKTIHFIRADSLPKELIAKLAAYKGNLVRYLTASSDTELMREALNPETALGKFFQLSGGLLDFTTPWCLAELQRMLDRRSSAAAVASSRYSLFGTAGAGTATATLTTTSAASAHPAAVTLSVPTLGSINA